MSCFHRQTWKQKYFYKIQRNMKPSVWSGNRFCCIPFRKKMPAMLKISGGWLPLQRALAKLLVMRVLSEVSSLCSYSSVPEQFACVMGPRVDIRHMAWKWGHEIIRVLVEVPHLYMIHLCRGIEHRIIFSWKKHRRPNSVCSFI